ncbi:MAG: hypothetical protein JWR09_126 [Mucilaginibacter sp.]|nr:hypothetical protein [Mucilaginibacter sp.]
MLAIEVDGMSHNHEEAFIKDETRQRTLEDLGVKFIRFTEAETKTDMQNVIRGIEGIILEIIKRIKAFVYLKSLILHRWNDGETPPCTLPREGIGRGHAFCITHPCTIS